MKFAVVRFCLVTLSVVSGCTGEQSAYRGPQADMTAHYPLKPFVEQHKAPPMIAGAYFVMPPDLPDLPSPTPTIQRPIKGTGENGAPPVYRPLTDTEASYGQ